jgi:hypothetical protein
LILSACSEGGDTTNAEGTLLKRPFEEGHEVEAGAVLFEIDREEFQANLLSAEAQHAEGAVGGHFDGDLGVLDAFLNLDEYAAGGWNEDALRARFDDQVRAWLRKTACPAIGSSLASLAPWPRAGGPGGALDAHRFLWLDAVRREADALGAAWAYWEYANPHGMSLMSPDETRRPDRIGLIALGLAEDPISTEI